MLLTVIGGREHFQIWKDARIRGSFMAEQAFKQELERWI